jgi:ABC-type glycerol-3-phosphate transport system substrate-binding protein
MIRRGTAGILALLMIGSMSACGSGSSSGSSLQGAADNEIITTTAVDQDKTMITVRVEFGAGQQENLEAVLEEEFPNVDIVLQHDGSTDSVYTIAENLKAGVGCDLIFSRRLPVVEDIASDYLLDLSAEDFVNNYYLNAVDSCADADGKVYYLPGPSDVYGIVYDKTLFEQNGWSVPGSYSEFVALLNQIAESGTVERPFAVSMMYPDVFQIVFNTYNFLDVYSGKDNYVWLADYQTGNGSMIGHMEPAVTKFRQLFDDGILSDAIFETTPSERSQMLYVDHSTAMIIECQNAVDYNVSLTDAAEGEPEVHEVAMMPFWTSDDAESDFVYAIPSYYMAINKASAEESDEKKQILLDIFSYLSSVEGQEMLIGNNFQISNIEGVSMQSNDFSQGIMDTISRGNIINTFYLAEGETNKQVERAMRETAEDLIDGNMTTEQWLANADATRDAYLSGSMTEEDVLGQSETTLTRLETAYTVAEMYAEQMDVPIGIVRGGGWDRSTNGYFYAGDITATSLAVVEPDKEVSSDDENADRIVTSTLTGQQILDILNDATPLAETLGFSSYFVAYGLDVTFAPWESEGNRVISCKLADGTALDPDATYEVAYFNGSLPDSISASVDQVSEKTWQEAFLDWLDGQDGTVQKPDMTLKLQWE